MEGFAESANSYNSFQWIVKFTLYALSRCHKEKNFTALFTALSILPKNQAVHLSVLQKLWNLQNYCDANNIVQAFWYSSLMQKSIRMEMTSIKLHDLVLDFARHTAKFHNKMQGFSDLLIKNYTNRNSHKPFALVTESDINSVEQEKMKNYTEWWDIPADGYIHENICHLLHHGGKIDELLWLLSQPQWIVFRFVNGGALHVAADLNEGSVALESSESSGKRREHFKAIGLATSLSRSYVQKNPYEAWFQLCGRLQCHATVNEWAEKFIRSLERAAPRPLVKAPLESFQQANYYSLGFVESKGDVLGIHFVKDAVHLIWRRENELGITSFVVNTENEKTCSLDMAYFEGNGCFSTQCTLLWAAFCADGSNVIVVHELLYVGIFKRETGALIRSYKLIRVQERREEIFLDGVCVQGNKVQLEFQNKSTLLQYQRMENTWRLQIMNTKCRCGSQLMERHLDHLYMDTRVK